MKGLSRQVARIQGLEKLDLLRMLNFSEIKELLIMLQQVPTRLEILVGGGYFWRLNNKWVKSQQIIIKFNSNLNASLHFNGPQHQNRIALVYFRSPNPNLIWCKTCCCELNTEKALELHEQSPKHLKKVKLIVFFIRNVNKWIIFHNRILKQTWNFVKTHWIQKKSQKINFDHRWQNFRCYFWVV